MTRPTPSYDITLLAVADVERAAAFYTASFGWRRLVSVPVYVELEMGPARALGLYLRDGFAVNTGRPATPPRDGHTTSTELYFRYDDAQPVMDALTAAGASLLSALAPRAWGDHAAYFADPDGNVIAVARPS
jgi:catechol 2,3-dioxygenase-like lactoylglutathione lyase family enzyme